MNNYVLLTFDTQSVLDLKSRFTLPFRTQRPFPVIPNSPPILSF